MNTAPFAHARRAGGELTAEAVIELYCADLAVCEIQQRASIGEEFIRRTQAAAPERL